MKHVKESSAYFNPPSSDVTYCTAPELKFWDKWPQVSYTVPTNPHQGHDRERRQEYSRHRVTNRFAAFKTVSLYKI
jgi:hypothetical protein